MCIVPATISCNIPGSDVSLGSDTGLNVLVEVRGPSNAAARPDPGPGRSPPPPCRPRTGGPAASWAYVPTQADSGARTWCPREGVHAGVRGL